MTHTRAAALLVACITAVSCGGGGGDGSSSSDESRTVTNAGVTITAPEGWVSATVATPPEIIVASTKADLAASAPAGARLTEALAPTGLPSAQNLVAGLDKASFVGPATPSETKVDGHDAAAVEWTESKAGVEVTERMVVVSVGASDALVLTLEAPKSAWRSNIAKLEAALASVRVDAKVVQQHS